MDSILLIRGFDLNPALNYPHSDREIGAPFCFIPILRHSYPTIPPTCVQL